MVITLCLLWLSKFLPELLDDIPRNPVIKAAPQQVVAYFLPEILPVQAGVVFRQRERRPVCRAFLVDATHSLGHVAVRQALFPQLKTQRPPAARFKRFPVLDPVLREGLIVEKFGVR